MLNTAFEAGRSILLRIERNVINALCTAAGFERFPPRVRETQKVDIFGDRTTICMSATTWFSVGEAAWAKVWSIKQHLTAKAISAKARSC